MRVSPKKLIALLVAFSISLAGCQLIDYARDTQEELKWPDNFAFTDTPADKITGLSWTVARREEVSAKSAKITFVRYWQRLRPNEATEFFIYEDLPATGDSQKRIYDQTVAAAQKDCAGAQFTMLKQESNEMWFEVKAPKCGDTPEYAEVDRYMFGIWDVFRLAYRIDAPAMSAEQRATGMQTLQSFQLVHG